MPARLAEEVDQEHLLIKSKPFSDAQSLFSLCHRCLNANQVLQASSVHPWHYSCLTCQHPFVLSALSFQNLALVEFTVDPTLSHQQVLQMINSQEEGDKDPSKAPLPVSDGWEQMSPAQQMNQSMDQRHNTPFF